MPGESEMTGLEFIRISRLSSKHLHIPSKELRELGLTGGKDEYMAIFRFGAFLLLAPLKKTESIQDIEEKIRSTLAGGAGEGRQVRETPPPRSLNNNGNIKHGFERS